MNTDLESRIESFTQKQKHLLHLEYTHVESCEDESPNQIKNLSLCEHYVGLFGKTVCSFQSSGQNPSNCNENDTFHKFRSMKNAVLLPAHNFSTGDDVEICYNKFSSLNEVKTNKEYKELKIVSGVVSKVSEYSISVILQDDSELEDNGYIDGMNYSIRARVSQEVRKRMEFFLNQIQRHYNEGRTASNIIRQVFQMDRESDFATIYQSPIDDEMLWFNHSLDTSQKEAIIFALQRDLALIHGPPGTGKTTAVVELIRQAVFRCNWKVLVCAPSNVAVDNILERLVTPLGGHGTTPKNTKNRKNKKLSRKLSTSLNACIPQVMRLGHPARLKPAILQHSMEVLVRSAEGTEIVQQCRKELKHWIDLSGNPKSKYAVKKSARAEIKLLRKEIKVREEKVVKELLHSRNVVLCTNIGAASRLLDEVNFDLVVIDEAAQALEASCWIPMLHGSRIVLAGDHNQLPPTIKSPVALREGLDITLFDRLIRAKTCDLSRMLSIQYRMHKDISDWASRELYNNQLRPASCVAEHKLSDLPHISSESDISTTTLLLIDTSGCDMHESITKSGSKYNDGEAKLVEDHVKSLVNVGLLPEDIAIITPYNGQVELLRDILLRSYPKLEIRSVDGFQGGEKEAVILSLVRSSEKDGIGFLSDERRLNVAITRARRHCAMICDSEHISSKSKFLERLVQWFEVHGECRSAMEFESQSSNNVNQDHLEILATSNATVQEESKKCRKDIAKQANDSNVQKVHIEKSLVTKLSSKLDQCTIQNKISGMDSSESSITISTEKTSNANRKLSNQLFTEAVPSKPDTNRLKQGLLLENNQGEETNKEVPEISTSNNLLAGLARERKNRQKAKTENRNTSNTSQSVTSHRKKAAKGFKTTTKSKPKVRSCDNKLEESNDHIEDDMAFLDAEIEKVQNSHGRKIEATGKNYRTIVNGILLAKPKSVEKVRDQRATCALRSKLKKAENDRKVKSSKKK